jgi:hypothetical protein
MVRSSRSGSGCRARRRSAYSFILTNLDVTAPDKAAAVEHWYRHRTTVENIFRDGKLGAALRHLPSGYPQVNMAWMWGALLAANMAAWLHHLTAITAGEDILAGHGVRGGKAMIATLRRRLIAVPGQADPPRPPPGAAATARPLPASRDPHPAAAATSTGLTCAPTAPLPVLPAACQPQPTESHLHREPGADPRAASMSSTPNPDPSRSLRRLATLFAESGGHLLGRAHRPRHTASARGPRRAADLMIG